MKGKDKFSTTEVEAIKKLILQKLQATTSQQKGIRDKIRDIGFYYSNYSSKKAGYTVEDFEALIRAGKITVIGSSGLSSSKSHDKDKTRIDADKIVENPIPPTTDLTTILSVFKTNRFDPLTNNETKIPDIAGNYILCLRSNSKLPRVAIEPALTIFDGLQVIYTGIASRSLRSRDYSQHFKGNNAGRSTLRKSLGVLFGYKQVPRDSDPTTGKTKFGTMDEINLTEWMYKNLILYFFPTYDFENIENQLINHFNPPLNLQGNDNRINKDFRQLLSQLRAQKGC